MNKNIKDQAAQRIAIVADDNKRTALIEWSYFNKDVLAQHKLIATSETAGILEGTLKSPVQKLSSKQTGGYEQLAGLMEAKKIDMLFFFAEPAIEKEKDSDLKKLLVLATRNNILLACNGITSDLVTKNVLTKSKKAASIVGERSFLKQLLPFVNKAAL